MHEFSFKYNLEKSISPFFIYPFSKNLAHSIIFFLSLTDILTKLTKLTLKKMTWSETEFSKQNKYSTSDSSEIRNSWKGCHTSWTQFAYRILFKDYFGVCN